jgi:hypothetical protein
MRCLIDKKVNHAEIYYKTYGWEPSPVSDIVFGANEIVPIDGIDLKAVLTEMDALGEKGELFVATHSDKEGLMMPLIKGAKASAGFGTMKKILTALEGVQQHQKIVDLPGSTSQAKRAASWLAWLNRFEPAIQVAEGFHVGNDDWEATVEGWYQAWRRTQQSTVLKLATMKDFDDLLGLVESVRATGFGRLEFRACQIGTSSDSLKEAARFFNCKTIVAPSSVLTFYSKNDSAKVVPDASIKAEAKRNNNLRKLQGTALVIFQSAHGFKALAPTEADVKAFLKTYIKKGYSGKIEPFVTGGVEPVGTAVLPEKKYIFPLEKEYLTFLVSVTL